TATTTHGSSRARSACGVPAAPCGPAWSPTATRLRSTGCSTPSPSWPLTAYAEGRRLGMVAMAAVGSLLAVLAGFLRDLMQLAVSPSILTALAATILAGPILAAVLALLPSVAGVSRTAALPMISRASALREKSWRAAFLRQRDPDAAGRARPPAPTGAPAAARSALFFPPPSAPGLGAVAA